MHKIMAAMRDFLSERFNLSEDKADEKQIVASITREAHFRGTNLWTLIFAIFIASMGLNVNSTAVIIGAMLISPLMGPIMGIGLAVGIHDFDLLKRGLKNLLIAAVLSITASSLYFFITPLHEASSELLARTHPSLWDVLIAFFGGMAGIVAGTRKEKSNVIPGVAIATALMPPLCTAGYGLATGQFFYFLGALYLFFINSLFICLATFLIVKHLKFHRKEFPTLEVEKRVSRYILIIVFVTVLPTIYLAYDIVQRSLFENNARKFVQAAFHLSKTQVITQHYTYSGNKKHIELLLVGQPLPESFLDSVRSSMKQYNLDGTDLIVHEGLDDKQQINLSEIKASILQDVFDNEKILDTTAPPLPGKLEKPVPPLLKELQVLYPSLQEYSLSHQVFLHADSARNDTLTVFIGNSHPGFRKKKERRCVYGSKKGSRPIV
jgi:uncharacterized hydrophobic protein (TIGR00271 family)